METLKLCDGLHFRTPWNFSDVFYLLIICTHHKTVNKIDETTHNSLHSIEFTALSFPTGLIANGCIGKLFLLIPSPFCRFQWRVLWYQLHLQCFNQLIFFLSSLISAPINFFFACMAAISLRGALGDLHLQLSTSFFLFVLNMLNS